MLRFRRAMPALLLTILLPGCASVNQLVALRNMTFDFAGISDVRIAGIPVREGARFGSLSVQDAARLSVAVASNAVPLELIAHVNATNPQSNAATARMTALDWSLFVEDRRALSGGIDHEFSVPPGRTTDLALPVRFDLLQLLDGGGARDFYELALAIAGQGDIHKNLRLELVPTIETSLGAMRFPGPIVVHWISGR